MKIRLPKGTLDLEGILMLGLVAAVLLMDAFAACSGEPAGDAMDEPDAAATIEWTLERPADYTANRYHKLSDEFDPAWDLTGALDDIGLLFRVGYRMADSGGWPNWREDNEFRAIRDADQGGTA